LDAVQRRFLREIGVTEQQAFVRFNLAPLQLRRDIAMLGLLFKAATGQAHPTLCAIFPKAVLPPPYYATRAASNRHGLQLFSRCDGSHTSRLGRSIFGLIEVFNALPPSLMEAGNVSQFQANLQRLARQRCEAGDPHWPSILSPAIRKS